MLSPRKKARARAYLSSGRTCIIEQSLWVSTRVGVGRRQCGDLPRDAERAIGLGEL